MEPDEREYRLLEDSFDAATKTLTLIGSWQDYEDIATQGLKFGMKTEDGKPAILPQDQLVSIHYMIKEGNHLVPIEQRGFAAEHRTQDYSFKFPLHEKIEAIKDRRFCAVLNSGMAGLLLTAGIALNDPVYSPILYTLSALETLVAVYSGYKGMTKDIPLARVMEYRIVKTEDAKN